jgi:hypothetical protein
VSKKCIDAMEEALWLKYLAYYRETFRIVDGDLLVAEPDLVKMTEFARQFKGVIKRVVEIELEADVTVNNGVKALEIYSFAFTTFVKIVHKLDILF